MSGTQHQGANERKASMPPHCGNCVFHEWDECTSLCRHPHKVTSDGLAEEVAQMAEDGGMSAAGIAESLLDIAICDQEWQSYDHVCDHWQGRQCPRSMVIERHEEEHEARAMARAQFLVLVESLMPGNGGDA